ncbi:MAG: class I tRNA ligase family protein, partial [Rubrivivax sp.]
HLLYARFWTKVMRDLELVQVDEPFTKLLTQGMVLNHIYSRRGDKGGIEYYWPHEVDNTFDASGKVVGARLKAAKGALPAGTEVDYEGVGTMSKSKNNGVDPQQLIDRYGADTARLFVMFASPPEQTLEWNDAGVEGANRFLRRLWAFGAQHAGAIRRATGADLSGAALAPAAKALRHEVHKVLGQVSYDYERMQYNTVVSGCMKLLNALEGFKPGGQAAGGSADDGDAAVLCEGFSVLLRALYPACPHITHALWSELGYAGAAGGLLDAPWPQVDEAALVQDEIELVLQVNGKHRGVLRAPAQAAREEIEQLAAHSAEVQRFAEGRPIRKIVVVPGRLVNVVA